MTVRILIGDVRKKLAEMPDESVHCVVTSPPYWGLRDYGVAGQLGLEPTLGEHIETMVGVFRDVRRVLRKDGTLWLNYGDCYATSPNGRSAADTKAVDNDDRTFRDKPFSTIGPIYDPSRPNVRQSKHPGGTEPQGRIRAGGTLKPKDLCMVPNRIAIALQEDGWWVRSEIIWAKPNPMPESTLDRPTSSHEKVWLLTKSARYYFDAEAVRESCESGPSDIKKMAESKERIGGKHKYLVDPLSKASAATNIGRKRSVGSPDGRNIRNVWNIATQPFPEAHFATFPPALIEPCIKAGTSEHGCCPECGAPWVREVERTGEVANHRGSRFDQGKTRARDGGDRTQSGQRVTKKTTGWRPSCKCEVLSPKDGSGNAIYKGPAAPVPCAVLDPFGGAGTTGLIADRIKRDAILIELNPEYAAMAEKRIHGDAGMFAQVAAE